MTSLLKSRKFWLLILDTVVSLGLFFVGKYAPGSMEDVKLIIVALQPLFILVIASITVEDVAAYRAGAHPSQLKANGAPHAG
jgi:hypothetical protein